MPFLTITETVDGKEKEVEYESQADFKFSKYAKSKFSTKDKEGNDHKNGVEQIYGGLLQRDTDALLQFWEASLAYLKEKKPTQDQIEDALSARIKKDGDIEPAIVEAFGQMEYEGFFQREDRQLLEAAEDGAEDEDGRRSKRGDQRARKVARRRLRNDESESEPEERTNGLDEDLLLELSARKLGVFCVDTILSWTPRQFRVFLKAAEHRNIDALDHAADKAMMQRAATNAKKISKKKIFDAAKAHKKIERHFNNESEEMESEPKVKRVVSMNKYLSQKRKEGA